MSGGNAGDAIGRDRNRQGTSFRWRSGEVYSQLRIGSCGDSTDCAIVERNSIVARRFIEAVTANNDLGSVGSQSIEAGRDLGNDRSHLHWRATVFGCRGHDCSQRTCIVWRRRELDAQLSRSGRCDNTGRAIVERHRIVGDDRVEARAGDDYGCDIRIDVGSVLSDDDSKEVALFKWLERSACSQTTTAFAFTASLIVAHEPRNEPKTAPERSLIHLIPAPRRLLSASNTRHQTFALPQALTFTICA